MRSDHREENTPWWVSRKISDEKIERLIHDVEEFINGLSSIYQCTLFIEDYRRDARQQHLPCLFRASLKLQVDTYTAPYTKQLDHSDFGRTKPSLGDPLGKCRAVISSVDVAEVTVDWPPFFGLISMELLFSRIFADLCPATWKIKSFHTLYCKLHFSEQSCWSLSDKWICPFDELNLSGKDISIAVTMDQLIRHYVALQSRIQSYKSTFV